MTAWRLWLIPLPELEALRIPKMFALFLGPLWSRSVANGVNTPERTWPGYFGTVFLCVNEGRGPKIWPNHWRPWPFCVLKIHLTQQGWPKTAPFAYRGVCSTRAIAAISDINNSAPNVLCRVLSKNSFFCLLFTPPQKKPHT